MCNLDNGCPIKIWVYFLYWSHFHLYFYSGADFDIIDSEGETPIHICARDGQLGLAQTLCAFGCNVDIVNGEGMQPLHLAAKHGNTEVARCLCLAGANIDAKNNEGVAPETCARVQGSELSHTFKIRNDNIWEISRDLEFYLNAIELLFLFIEQLDRLEVLPYWWYSKNLGGIQIKHLYVV